MFKTAQEVLLANTMISVQDYAACWAEGGGVVLRVDGEKPFAPLSQAVGQEGWIFYTVTTVLPFPGEIRDKHEEGGPSGGQENRPWEEGEARRRKVLATQHERGSCFQGYSKDRIPPLCYPIVTGRSCLTPLPPQKWLIFSQFCGLESRAKIQSPNTSHTTIESSFLSLLRVLNVNFLTLFARFKCGVKYPHVTIADWEKGVKECITKEVK